MHYLNALEPNLYGKAMSFDAKVWKTKFRDVIGAFPKVRKCNSSILKDSTTFLWPFQIATNDIIFGKKALSP